MRTYTHLISLLTIFLMLPTVSNAKIPPAKCQSLHCVRIGIDSIDTKIILLLKQRLDYVARAGQLKKGKRPIHDQAREDRILKQVAKEGSAAGVPSAFARAVFKTILAGSNQYEHCHQDSTVN